MLVQIYLQVINLLSQWILVRLWSSKIIWNVCLVHCPCSTVSHLLHHLQHNYITQNVRESMIPDYHCMQ